jgi:hypothetical protein
MVMSTPAGFVSLKNIVKYHLTLYAYHVKQHSTV